jgi:hypothetical protein
MEVVMTDGAKRVRKHREKMEADVNSPAFKAQLARAIELINADPESQRVMEEMLALSDFSDWK